MRPAHRFPRVSRLRKGYHPRQVDAFLNHIEVSLSGVFPPPTAQEIRQAGFELVHRGYDTAAVDAALDALEEKVLLLAHRVSGRRGRVDVAGETEFLVGELSRPYMKRFPRAGGMHRGYDVDEVDEYLDRVIAGLRDGPPVTVEEVRGASFRSRRGGYAEDAVDETLDRVVELLLLARQEQQRSGPAQPVEPVQQAAAHPQPRGLRP